LTSPPEPLVFFVDRSLGRNVVAGALRAAGEQIQVHDDHFPQNTPDETWLKEVGQHDWIVLTKDTRIRYRAIETNALCAAKVRAFVLTAKGDLSGTEMAEVFIKALPRIRRLCAKTKPPFIAKVSRDGNVMLIQ